MNNNRNERLSRRDRYSSKRVVDPGGSTSRNLNDTKSFNNNENTIIRRSAPSRSNHQNNSFRESRENSRRQVVTSPTNENQSSNNPTKNRISKQKKPNNNKKRIWGRVIRYGLYLASIGIISLFLLCVYWIAQAPSFDPAILDNNSRTIVYDKNDKEVAKLGNEIGENVEMKDVPKQMQDAILATEDNRFFEHGAVDYRRLVGAVFSNITSGFGSQGGSTISQQLIKRTFLDDNKSIKRKVQEAYLAYKLEQNYDKETIFNMYINRIYYSDGVYGLRTAANYYYGKELKELTLPQMAFLAGLPQQPNGYNPYDHPENAKTRRDTVLYLMQYHGKISEEEAIAAQNTDILKGIVPRNSNNRFKLSSSFDSDYTAYMSQVEYELRKSEEFKDFEGDVLNLGLKVYTNLDQEIQDTVSTSMKNNLVGIKQASDVAMVVLNNENSGVSALYGGKNFKFGGFNIATQSKLQPGSAIKPILAYGPAVEYLGWGTDHTVDDSKIPGSHIQNWDRQFHGKININYALMMSFNIPAIKTFQEVGFENVKRYANNVGMQLTDDSITSPIGGSGDGYSPLQMAGAYVPFSNGGYYATPKTIRKVFDNEGNEIKEFSKNVRKQVIKESTAYIMTSMLRNVVNGTAPGAVVPGLDMGVKTGTTTFSEADAKKYGFDIDDYSKDSWIVGYSSNYTLAVWQGFTMIDGPTKFLTKNDTMKTQALYRLNMQNINKIRPAKGFSVPENVGSYNGGIKVLSDDEKREIEENKRRQEEEKISLRKKEEETVNKDNNDKKEESSNNVNTTNKNSEKPANENTVVRREDTNIPTNNNINNDTNRGNNN